jgi:hypothetical protein
MNHHHMNAPVFPGAMSPVQLVQRALYRAIAIVTTAAAVAALSAVMLIFN